MPTWLLSVIALVFFVGWFLFLLYALANMAARDDDAEECTTGNRRS
jgi:hypothetical protein